MAKRLIEDLKTRMQDVADGENGMIAFQNGMDLARGRMRVGQPSSSRYRWAKVGWKGSWKQGEG